MASNIWNWQGYSHAIRLFGPSMRCIQCFLECESIRYVEWKWEHDMPNALKRGAKGLHVWGLRYLKLRYIWNKVVRFFIHMKSPFFVCCSMVLPESNYLWRSIIPKGKELPVQKVWLTFHSQEVGMWGGKPHNCN